jgi:hypothetical protein
LFRNKAEVVDAFDHSKHEAKAMYLGKQAQRITVEETARVKSVPAVVLKGQSFHVNFSTSIDGLK